MLSGEVARRYGHDGLPDDTIHIQLQGTAGQSVGAFLAHGITLELVGEANDYVGKGLSGGRIILRPHAQFRGAPQTNMVAGNTVLYGAISGEAYFYGIAGERFAVRNSGANTVIEGTGDHGCEYMTGGTVVVLGETGRNFAAGMSGGIAYVYDPDGQFEKRCNLAMVTLEPVPDGKTQEKTVDRAVWHSMTRGGKRETDEAILRRLIENHFTYTGSTSARQLLDNWAQSLTHFVKVFPAEYRGALRNLYAKEKTAKRVPA
jgi:glutamate synthase (NADPH/NADH) large chain